MSVDCNIVEADLEIVAAVEVTIVIVDNWLSCRTVDASYSTLFEREPIEPRRRLKQNLHPALFAIVSHADFCYL